MDRTTRGCTLTAAGQEVLVAAERMEEEMLGVASRLQGAENVVAGTIRVGAPDGFGSAFNTLRKAKSVTHVSGTKRHLCLGSGTEVHTGDIVYTGYRRDGLQPVRGEWVWRRFDAAVLLVEES